LLDPVPGSDVEFRPGGFDPGTHAGEAVEGHPHRSGLRITRPVLTDGQPGTGTFQSGTSLGSGAVPTGEIPPIHGERRPGAGELLGDREGYFSVEGTAVAAPALKQKRTIPGTQPRRQVPRGVGADPRCCAGLTDPDLGVRGENEHLQDAPPVRVRIQGWGRQVRSHPIGAAPTRARAGTGDTSVTEFGQQPLWGPGGTGQLFRSGVQQSAAGPVEEDLGEHLVDLVGGEFANGQPGGCRWFVVHSSPLPRSAGARCARRAATQERTVSASHPCGSLRASLRSTVCAGSSSPVCVVSRARSAVSRPCPLPASAPRVSKATVARSRTTSASSPRMASSGSVTSRITSAVPPQCRSEVKRWPSTASPKRESTVRRVTVRRAPPKMTGTSRNRTRAGVGAVVSMSPPHQWAIHSRCSSSLPPSCSQASRAIREAMRLNSAYSAVSPSTGVFSTV